MTEADLSNALVKLLRKELPGAVVFKHSDKFTGGIPDISVTWRGSTVWLEVKYANPKVQDTGLQALTLKRLAVAGEAWYVIYQKSKEQRWTYIVAPSNLTAYVEHYTACAGGYDHQAVVTFLKNLME